ncbi:substrate-binding domain-containing protein [Dellaglioa sp. L3N]
MKKIVTLVSVFALAVVVLAGCGASLDNGSSDKTTKTAKIAPKKLKIGVSLSTLSNPFFVSVKSGITSVATKNGTNVEVMDAQDDSAKQSNDIEDLIQKKVDIIIVNPVDSDAITPEIKNANDANIPVIALDRSSTGGKVLTLVASDNVKGGKMAAEYMSKKLGKNAKVAELQGTPGASATRERGKGFDENVKGKLDVVTKQSANFDRAKGLSVMENLLQSNPDIKGVFSQNDEMALGAIEAAKSAGKSDLVIVGFDGSVDGLKSVKMGKLTATVAQQPKEMGKIAIKAAYDHFNGKKLDKKISSPLELVTK